MVSSIIDESKTTVGVLTQRHTESMKFLNEVTEARREAAMAEVGGKAIALVEVPLILDATIPDVD